MPKRFIRLYYNIDTPMDKQQTHAKGKKKKKKINQIDENMKIENRTLFLLLDFPPSLSQFDSLALWSCGFFSRSLALVHVTNYIHLYLYCSSDRTLWLRTVFIDSGDMNLCMLCTRFRNMAMSAWCGFYLSTWKKEESIEITKTKKNHI